MADNEETQIGLSATLGSVSHNSIDGSTNSNVATTAAVPDPVIDYDAQGGAVTTSENKQHSLLSLFEAFDRDVFYPMKDIGLNEAGAPCVLFALAQKFPGINQQEFLDAYKSATHRKILRLPNFSCLHRHEGREHGTKWIMVKSHAELVPYLNPKDQIAVFAAQSNIKDFWPYQGIPNSSPNSRRRATFEACNAQFNRSSDISATGDNATQSASLPSAATAGFTKKLKPKKLSSTSSPRHKLTKVSTTTVDEAAKLLSSLTGPPPRKKIKAATLRPKAQSATLKAAPATTKKATTSTTSTTTKAAAKMSTATPGSPRRKKAKVSTQPLTTKSAASITDPPGTTPLEETPVWQAYQAWLDKGSEEQVPKFTNCPGFRRNFIEESVGIEAEKRKKTMTGFSHLCGEGLHNFAAKISENEKLDSKWPIVGALRSNRTKEKDSWMWMVSMLEPYDDRNFAIHSANCVGEAGDKHSFWPLCRECTRGKHGLFERCRKAVDIRAGPIPDKQRIDTLVCPTLSRKRMEQDREKFRRYQTKVGRLVAKKVAEASTPAPSTFTFFP
jgi:hypothetical protein